ncbi:MAG TPA: M61 family peptidase [Patescibacteria group bacterium]|nr:M61 family peptidase [Patescibacteria group bacterium]
MFMPLRVAAVTMVASLALGSAGAQPSRPAPPLTLDVDATDAPRKLYHVHLSVPAKPGTLTLLYPKWIPGEHGPTGPVTDVVGLVVRAGGATVPWKRDDADMFTIRCEVPAGPTTVDIAFDFISPPSTVEGFSSAASGTAQLATINWNQLLMYPAGTPARDLMFKATLKLPTGWRMGTPLPIASQAGAATSFSTVSLETLVDSPVIAGAFFKELRIGPTSLPPHFVEIAADSAAALEANPETKAAWDKLVVEANALFGAHHYESYRFLLALSDGVAHFGLEHHQGSDDRVEERTLLDEDLRRAHATLLCHEFVHSWNGKHRRPADIATPDFQQPMRTSLLWVYEGLTQYLGYMLTARSGLWTPQEYRDKVALLAEWAADQKGRTWRPLVDTAVAAQLLFEARDDWEAWRRGTDFYDEGALIWLDADTLIREKTQGRKSLDDFCRRFHGGASGPPSVIPYTFDDIVENLNAVAPYDWRGFLNVRINQVAPVPPLNGIERSGWRLVYADTPSPLQKSLEKQKELTDMSASIGILVKKDGTLSDIVPGKPADLAGAGPGMKLVAVNGRRYSADVLREAVAASRSGSGPLELLVENGEYFRTLSLAYHDGARYPRLERIPSKPDLLSQIIRPSGS